MLYRFLIFYLFGFGNSFIIHKTDVTKVKLKNSFDEMPHEVKTLSDFLLSGNEDDFIEIVEYEDG